MDARENELPDPIDNHQTVVKLSEHDFRMLVIKQFRVGRDNMKDLAARIDENTELTKANIASTAELVDIFKGAKTGASAFAWCGRNLRSLVTYVYPFALLVGAVVAIWHGKWPKWGE